jgi:transcriptional regulator with XRE-family HTH domain
MNLTETIKILCIKRNMPLTELAEKTGQSQQNLTNKLRRNDFKSSELEKIAAALGARLELKFIDLETGESLI